MCQHTLVCRISWWHQWHVIGVIGRRCIHVDGPRCIWFGCIDGTDTASCGYTAADRRYPHRHWFDTLIGIGSIPPSALVRRGLTLACQGLAAPWPHGVGPSFCIHALFHVGMAYAWHVSWLVLLAWLGGHLHERKHDRISLSLCRLYPTQIALPHMPLQRLSYCFGE